MPNVQRKGDLPLDAFGGGPSFQGVTKAVDEISDLGMQIGAVEKRKADELAVQEGFIKTVQMSNRLFWDPEKGAMTKQGKNALGVSNEYGSQFDTEANEIENGLANGSQKAMYRRLRERERAQFTGKLEEHTFREMQKFAEETMKTGLATTVDDAVLNFQDAGRVERDLDLQEKWIANYAVKFGKPPEWVELETKTWVSKTHRDIVQRLLNNMQHLDAQTWFDSHKKQGNFTGDDAADLEKLLTDKELPFQQATNIVEESKGAAPVPEPILAKLTLAQRKALEERQGQLLQGIPAVTDWGTYTSLIDSAIRDRVDFIKTDLMLYRSRLADPEFKALMDLKTEITNGSSKLLDGYRSDQQIVNDTLAAAGIDPTPKHTSPAAKRVNEFRSLVDNEVKVLQNRTGKKATNDDIQRIVDNLMVKSVTHRGIFWDTKKPLYELKEGQPVDVDYRDIPRLERAKVEDALRARKLPVNPKAVTELYNRKLKRMVDRGIE